MKSDSPPPRRALRLFARYVAFAERHAGALLVFFLAIGAIGAWRAVPLVRDLHTDFSELLPDHHPAVDAFRRVAALQKSATNLVMIIHSPSQEANHRLAEALRPSLQKMIPTTFSEIQWKPDPEPSLFAQKWKWLYADRKDLENAEDLLDRVISKRSSPVYVDIDGDAEDELRDLRKRLNKKIDEKAAPVAASEYYEMHDAEKDGGQYWLGVMMWRKRDGLATAGDHQTLQAVKAAVAAANPTSFHPQMQVEYTGHIAVAIDEQNGIRDDVTLAALLVGLGVLFVIWLYFRRVALILVVFAPALLGTLLALTLASVTIRYLNVNTAFLISIILGNGINAPIIMLARYGEERRSGRAVDAALSTAMAETLLGTLAAMAAASAAYGSLLFTSFRGFNQFGLLGGAGMLLVWLSMFFVVPPLVLAGEKLLPGHFTPRDNLLRKPFTLLGRLSESAPGGLSLVTLVLLIASVPAVLRYVKDPLEWNFNNLRSDETNVPSQKLWPRMDQLGMGNVGAGYVGNNGVLFVDTPEQADPVAEALRQKDKQNPKPLLREVRTLSTWLPKDQGEKLDILKRIRTKIDKHKAMMDDDEQQEALAWRPPDDLRPVTGNDLPRIVREAFSDTDGQRGRLIGVDAEYANYSDWDGHDLLRMSETLTVDALGKRWHAASAGNVFAGMLEAIITDGPRVTLAAIVGVALLVLVAFGPRGALPVITSLGVGVFWWAALLEHFHIRINFMNFASLPITLGVGADYAANIWARLRSEGKQAGGLRPGRLTQIIADTGSAVALCSLTTIIGYSSLLKSHNRALRSFGIAADLGELTCLAAALLALPALIRLFGRRQKA